MEYGIKDIDIILMISILISILIVILIFLVNNGLGYILVVLFVIIYILFSRIFVNIGCGLDYELQIMNRLKNDLIVGDRCCNIRTRLILNSYCIESIIIGCDSFCSVNEFVVDGLNELKLVKIGSRSFSTIKCANDWDDDRVKNDCSRSFAIMNCIKLESIEIGRFSFVEFGKAFELVNLPSLISIKIGSIESDRTDSNDKGWSLNFCYSSFVVIGIIDMILLMNRSSTFEFHQTW